MLTVAELQEIKTRAERHPLYSASGNNLVGLFFDARDDVMRLIAEAEQLANHLGRSHWPVECWCSEIECPAKAALG